MVAVSEASPARAIGLMRRLVAADRSQEFGATVLAGSDGSPEGSWSGRPRAYLRGLPRQGAQEAA